MSALDEPEDPFPRLDADPHFFRVVRYMRLSDLGIWAGATGLMPAALRAWEHIDSTQATARGLRSALRINASLGFFGGFLLAYQRSSMRFWGWSENAREAEMDMTEMTARVRAGKPLYGESSLDEYVQGVAARNSTYSQLKLQTMPWFNFANHNRHGVDTSKYYEAAGAGPPSQPS